MRQSTTEIWAPGRSASLRAALRPGHGIGYAIIAFSAVAAEA